MKIAPNRTRRKSARLVAYAVFQNKYICHFIILQRIMSDVVGVGVPDGPKVLILFIVNLYNNLNDKKIKIVLKNKKIII